MENASLTAIAGITAGHVTDELNMTGVTVVRFAGDGARAAVSVQGAAPGTRETDLLEPGNLVEKVHAIVLTGGSAYGLDCLLYTSPSPRDRTRSRMPSSA